MDDKKGPNNRGLIITLIVFLIIILGLIGYICYDKELILNNKKENVSTKETTKNKKTSDTTNTENTNNVGINTEKCINCEDKNLYYDITSKEHIDEVSASFSTKDKTKGNITIDIDAYNTKAATNFNLQTSSIEYNFDKSIKDVLIYNIGQENLAPIVMYLMEDGTVNYIDVYQGLTDNNLTEYKTINDVKDITNLYTASSCSEEYCNANTILAQKSDGTFYDLMDILYPVK